MYVREGLFGYELSGCLSKAEPSQLHSNLIRTEGISLGMEDIPCSRCDQPENPGD